MHMSGDDNLRATRTRLWPVGRALLGTLAGLGGGVVVVAVVGLPLVQPGPSLARMAVVGVAASLLGAGVAVAVGGAAGGIACLGQGLTMGSFLGFFAQAPHLASLVGRVVILGGSVVAGSAGALLVLRLRARRGRGGPVVLSPREALDAPELARVLAVAGVAGVGYGLLAHGLIPRESPVIAVLLFFFPFGVGAAVGLAARRPQWLHLPLAAAVAVAAAGATLRLAGGLRFRIPSGPQAAAGISDTVLALSLAATAIGLALSGWAAAASADSRHRPQPSG